MLVSEIVKKLDTNQGIESLNQTNESSECSEAMKQSNELNLYIEVMKQKTEIESMKRINALNQ